MNDVNIVTGRCFNLFPWPSFNYSCNMLQKTTKDHPITVGSTSVSPFQYVSPLLMFKAYRLCPLYRAVFKLPLSSQTHSHSIDPNVPFCRFESQGKCNDPDCTAQHKEDITLAENDVAKDLLQYIKEKPSDLDKAVRSKMSDKEWLILTAHNVYQQLNKCSVVSASEEWLNNTSKSIKATMSTAGHPIVPVPLDEPYMREAVLSTK